MQNTQFHVFEEYVVFGRQRRGAIPWSTIGNVLGMTYLSGIGVEEVNELEARVLNGQSSLSDHQVQRALGFFQQSI